MRLAGDTLSALMLERPEPTAARPQGLCLDQGYDYAEVRETVAQFGFTSICTRVARRRGVLNERQVSVRDAGLLNARTVG